MRRGAEGSRRGSGAPRRGDRRGDGGGRRPEPGERPDATCPFARRYFFAGTFDKAFDHYMAVLNIQPDAEAMANVGWITYVGSDEVDTALSLVEESLAIESDNPMAFWFLANIQLGGFDDALGAIEPLRQFLAYPDVPQELRSEAEVLLEMAEAAI